MIEVEHLWKVYDQVEAVRDLSFVVEPGEVLGLVGPNGAGKTSTMRCLCGIIPPSAGEIRVCGLSMYESPVEAKRRVAFVPSEPRYFPYLTVWEHLQMFARLYHCGDQSERATGLLESMSLVEKRDHLPDSLSRGMQQKLMIACALIHTPQVLIFDEPFTGLDPLAIRNIRKILRACADEGAAVLLSSHLLAMVEEMVDRVLIIQAGQKVAHGAVDALASTMPTLRKDADLEEIFLHATGEQSDDSQGRKAPKGTQAAHNDNALTALVDVTKPVPIAPVGDTEQAASMNSAAMSPAMSVDTPDLMGGEAGASLPYSSSEVLPAYTALEGSLASQEGLPAAQKGKWFGDASDASEVLATTRASVSMEAPAAEVPADADSLEALNRPEGTEHLNGIERAVGAVEQEQVHPAPALETEPSEPSQSSQPLEFAVKTGSEE